MEAGEGSTVGPMIEKEFIHVEKGGEILLWDGF